MNYLLALVAESRDWFPFEPEGDRSNHGNSGALAPLRTNGGTMGTRFYFHTDNDELDLDDEGTELRDLEQARHEALALLGDVLAQANGASLWNGKPWKVWVSDGPNRAGRVLFTLQLSAS